MAKTPTKAPVVTRSSKGSAKPVQSGRRVVSGKANSVRSGNVKRSGK